MKAQGLFLAVAVLAGHALAQSPGEISFWESVRDSKDPAELRAYLQQYPNGTFRAIAESRLAALEKTPHAARAPAAAPAQVVAGARHVPQVGDRWTYRLSYPRLRGQWGQAQKPPRTYVATVTASGASISDQVSVDGATPITKTHEKGGVLLDQGASIFSPYLEPPASGRLGGIAITDPGCNNFYLCEAKGSIAGQEVVTVPAGRFQATRIVVTHEWRPAQSNTMASAQYQGGRTLTVWYVPELGRAVKYSSRLTVGTAPPVEANFDLELVSYRLQ